MRAGIRLAAADWTAVVVDDTGAVIAEHTEPSSETASAGDAFAWLASVGGGRLRSATLDVSDILGREPRSETLVVRISPRAPIDAAHELAVSAKFAGIVTRSIHVSGGHDMRGRVLAPLDQHALERELAGSGDHLVVAVTAVGSIANPEIEQRSADLILAAFPESRVALSHDFYSNAIRDRDFTATMNAGLLIAGEALAARIERSAEHHLPNVPVFVALNDGGRAPIRRLGATPVHALNSSKAMRVQAASQLTQVTEGSIVIVADGAIEVGHVHGGVPATNTLVKRGQEPSLASNTARITRYSSTVFDTALRPAKVLLTGARDDPIPPHVPKPSHVVSTDLVAYGAAVCALSAWADFLGRASNATELRTLLSTTEEDLRTQMIYWGADPGTTRVIESSAYTLAYGSRNVVRARVRIIGDWIGSTNKELPAP